jgi:plasmid stabilization system protein ParE
MALTYDDVLEGFLKLSPEEQTQLLETARMLQGEDAGQSEIFDDEIRELVKNLGQHPASGPEIVAEGLTGAWADQGIEDSVAWLAELRRKRRDKFR